MSSLDTLKRTLKNADIRYYNSYAGLWTAFNSFYSKYYEEQTGTPPNTDLEAINFLRVLTSPNDLVASFNNISKMSDGNIQPIINQLKNYHSRESEPLSDSYSIYVFNNVVVRFVEFAWINPVVREKLWLGNNSDRPTGFRPKKIATRFLPRAEFIDYYRKLSEFYARPENMPTHAESFQTTLEEFGVKTLGSCIYLESPSVTPHSHTARYLQSQFYPEMKQFLRSTEQNGLFADIIQILYVVRNVCVHGEWNNPTEEANKLTLQAAYECLYQLLLQYVGEPINRLHP